MKMEKKRKEKRVGIKYLKRKYCVGTEPSAYIGILVTSTTTGQGGSVVSALASQAKGRGSIPRRVTSFFSHKFFLSPLSKLCGVIEQTINIGQTSYGHIHLINVPLK